jgi:hypothetical protein
MKNIFILAILFCNGASAQTWPTKDCKDVPYIKGNDDVIYHTCKCDTVRRFLCGPLYCPECNHITNEEHMATLRKETSPDKWNQDMQQALIEGCPIKEHKR